MKKDDFKRLINFILLHRIKFTILVACILFFATIGFITSNIIESFKNSSSYYLGGRLVYEKDIEQLRLENAGLSGTIDFVKQVEEYDSNAKDLSQAPSVTYENGTVSNSGTTSLKGGNSSVISASSRPSGFSVVQDNSSLTGTGIKVKEGASFNPLNDLNLEARDKNGKNISNKIQIISNNVNTTVPGHYTVVARVVLSDGATLTKTFNVEVLYQSLKVQLEKIVLNNPVVEKGTISSLNLTITSSKEYIKPCAAQINEEWYALNDLDTNRYTLNFESGEISGINEYKITGLKMTDGSVITVNKTFSQTVNKSNPRVSDFKAQFDDNKQQLKTQIKIEDLDNSVDKYYKPMILLYDSNNKELDRQTVSVNQIHYSYFNIDKNDDYQIKVIASIKRNDSSVLEEVELYSYNMNIDSIDKTSLDGKNIEIAEGSSFEAIRDLNLTATDRNGQDISHLIQIQGEVDVLQPGEYEITASVITENGLCLEKIFTVLVKPVNTVINHIQLVAESLDLVDNESVDLGITLELSKDYVELDKVIINSKEYLVDYKESLNRYQVQKYVVSSDEAEYLLNLTQLVLSNGETIDVDETLKFIIHQPIPTSLQRSRLVVDYDLVENMILSNTIDSNSYAVRNSSIPTISTNQSLSGPETNQITGNMNLSGIVRAADGSTPAGRIEVSLPTAISFVVDQNGGLQLPTSLPVNNNSSVPILLSIQGFTESLPNDGITLQSQVFDTDPRSTIALQISGNVGNTVSLLHNGIGGTKPLLSLVAGQAGSLIITGQAGKASDSKSDLNGIIEQFTITFTIQKQ